MFREFFTFELRHRFKQPMVYIFLIITALLYFLGVTVENATIGVSVRNIHVNSPYAIIAWSAFYAFIGLMFTTAFANTSALRDFSYKYDGILFSTPLKKWGFFMGRFWGACLVAIIPALGIFVAVLLGSQMPWIAENKLGGFYPMAYWESLIYFIIPNVFFASAIIFSIAILTRSTIMSFIGAIAMIVGYGVAISYVSDLESELLGIMLDPFGINSLQVLTKYWTIGDKNTITMGINPLLIANRLLWFIVGLLILGASYFRFSFTARKSKRKSKESAVSAVMKPAFAVLTPLPKVHITDNAKTRWLQLWTQIKLDFIGILKSTAFIVIMVFGLFNMGTALTHANEAYGLTAHPVTYSVMELIQGTLYLFVLIIMVFYSGVLVWKERDAKMDGIYNALPYPTWLPFVAKYIAVIAIVAVIQLIAVFTGMAAQAMFGYFNFEIGVFFKQFFLIDWVGFALAAALSMLIHALVNNKYLAYFVFLVVFFLNGLIWVPLDVQSNMVSFAATPNPVYSDMNKFGPYTEGLVWFSIYWIFFAALLGIAVILFWVRESGASFKQRMGIAKRRFAGNYKIITAVFALLWLVTGGFVYYNTQVLNTYATPDTIEERSVEYEQKYKQYENLAQPRITDISYNIEVFPYERDVKIEAKVWVKNKSTEPIAAIHFNMPQNFKAKVDLPNSTIEAKDTVLNYWIYNLKTPLQAGDSLQYVVHSDYITKGFENDVSFTQVVQNGTFFNNMDFMPSMGYQEGYELSDKKDRKEHNLPAKPTRMPELEHNCSQHCMNTYLSNDSDWVTVDCTISTATDQIAIAPGSLQKEWTEGDRRYFHYTLDHPSLNFYSFISARYEVARDKWKDVDVEVYYHKGHEYNVDKMLNSIKKSLDYNSTNFSPYRHKQARIIEFPRYQSFAQAFPGTMPYSESIGFIADIDEEEEDIDMVFYVVAHEMAHQWWAHQVIGANMQGGTVLSETFAQYSALMTMEKEYGRDRMNKFLKYEMDRYLRGRGGESDKEMPLMRVENQPYIHYRKGSVIMYALREFIGEEALNGALKTLVDSTAYREPPYPTTLTLMGLLEEATPDSLQYLLTDMFEEITLYSNRTLEASYKELDGGRYEVTFKTESQKFKADSVGLETPVERLNDWVDIGVFGEAPKGKKEGELIYKQRVRINKAENTFTVIVPEKPSKAGIDPNHILIDRVPDDNVKKVSEGG
ncbi:MAG: M1 family aminopeptidase [Chitinophagales bacterium]